MIVKVFQDRLAWLVTGLESIFADGLSRPPSCCHRLSRGQDGTGHSVRPSPGLHLRARRGAAAGNLPRGRRCCRNIEAIIMGLLELLIFNPSARRSAHRSRSSACQGDRPQRGYAHLRHSAGLRFPSSVLVPACRITSRSLRIQPSPSE